MNVDIHAFVAESNRIEGILREPTADEITELRRFVHLPKITITDLERFVSIYQPNARLRDKAGLDVRVGDYIAPPGGPNIVDLLGRIISLSNMYRQEHHAFSLHHKYEALHPFTDCNGRSGRALWLWQIRGDASLGFLHTWYYQSLRFGR